MFKQHSPISEGAPSLDRTTGVEVVAPRGAALYNEHQQQLEAFLKYPAVEKKIEQIAYAIRASGEKSFLVNFHNYIESKDTIIDSDTFRTLARESFLRSGEFLKELRFFLFEQAAKEALRNVISASPANEDLFTPLEHLKVVTNLLNLTRAETGLDGRFRAATSIVSAFSELMYNENLQPPEKLTKAQQVFVEQFLDVYVTPVKNSLGTGIKKFIEDTISLCQVNSFQERRSGKPVDRFRVSEISALRAVKALEGLSELSRDLRIDERHGLSDFLKTFSSAAFAEDISRIHHDDISWRVVYLNYRGDDNRPDANTLFWQREPISRA